MYSERNEAIRNEVAQMLNCNVTISEVQKGNGITLTGLTVRQDDSNVAPVIYLNGYNSMSDVHDIALDIISKYENAKSEMKQIEGVKDLFTDWAYCKENLFPELVSMSDTRTSVYLPFLDLKLIARVNVGNTGDGIGSFIVTEQALKSWEIDKFDLFEALQNVASKNAPSDVVSMASMIAEMAGIPIEENQITDELRMTVVTNKSRVFGASVIWYDGMIKKIQEVLDSETFILIPSSIHEVIVVRSSETNHCSNMVKEVNETQVQPDEVLSDHVYYYDGEKFVW